MNAMTSRALNTICAGCWLTCGVLNYVSYRTSNEVLYAAASTLDFALAGMYSTIAICTSADEKRKTRGRTTIDEKITPAKSPNTTSQIAANRTTPITDDYGLKQEDDRRYNKLRMP